MGEKKKQKQLKFLERYKYYRKEGEEMHYEIIVRSVKKRLFTDIINTRVYSKINFKYLIPYPNVL